VVLAPKARSVEAHSKNAAPARFSWSLAFASAAAAAVVAFVFAPQLASLSSGGYAGSQIAKNGNSTKLNTESGTGVQLVANADDADVGPSRPATEPEMLRDPRIDSYLQAHQRFSPAIGNGQHYAAHAGNATSASEK
jgi:sigma-E factor negative regulatory protein RseA